jgi:predicted porin
MLRTIREYKYGLLIIMLGVGSIFSPATSFAQSSVTLYGVIDTGIQYTTNVGGKHQVEMLSNILSPNLLGLRGKEDLGNGLAAIFVLEGQFDVDNGSSIGNLFGRQSYVGLTDAKWGSLTAGNQYDFMFTSLTVKRYGPAFPYTAIQSVRQGPFNGLGIPNQSTPGFDFDRMSGERINNSVKYESPNISGLSFGAMYGFGGVAGSTARNSSQSFALDYGNDRVNLDAAYTYVRYPGINNGSSGIRNFGFGGGVFVGSAYFDALYTSTENTFTGARVDVYEVGGMYSFSPVLRVLGAYQFMSGNKVLNNNKASQINALIDYSLSKRTNVYASAIYQHATGNGAQAEIITLAPASGANQLSFRVGIQHVF